MKRITKIIISLVIIGLIGFFVGKPYLDNSLRQDDIDLIINTPLKKSSSGFNSSNFSNLPYVVKKYLRRSIKNDSQTITGCTYTATGKSKEKKNDNWINTSIKTYYSATASNFLSVIKSERFPFIWNELIKSYINNRASTSSKLLSSITLKSFEGNKLNKSYVVLYLLQSVFCPSVLLPNMNVHWKNIDRTKAIATIWDDNLKGSAIFYFNEKSEVTKIETEDRFMPGDLDYKRERFTLHLANYKDVDNFYIPTFFEYQWNLAGEDFTFGRFQISEITYK